MNPHGWFRLELTLKVNIIRGGERGIGEKGTAAKYFPGRLVGTGGGNESVTKECRLSKKEGSGMRKSSKGCEK